MSVRLSGTEKFSIYADEIEQDSYKHKTVPRCNGKKKFAEGDVHINNAENIVQNLQRNKQKCLGLWTNSFQPLSNLKGETNRQNTSSHRKRMYPQNLIRAKDYYER